jgi:hypothetical protein
VTDQTKRGGNRKRGREEGETGDRSGDGRREAGMKEGKERD